VDGPQEHDLTPAGLTGYFEQFLGTVLTSVTRGPTMKGDWLLGIIGPDGEPDTIAISGPAEASAFLSGAGVAVNAMMRRLRDAEGEQT
jgi:cellulase/cellobiase CelA1